jgi:surface antigen
MLRCFAAAAFAAALLLFGTSLSHDTRLASAAAVVRAPAPTFKHHRRAVSAGRSLRLVVATHAQWEQPQACQLSVRHSGTRTRRFAYRGVVSDLLFTFRVGKRASAGTWRFAMRCRSGRGGWSHTAHTSVRLRGSRGSGPLVGHRGPRIDPLQAGAPAHAGYGGVGAPPNPGFPDGQCTFWAFTKRPDIYWTSHNNGAPAGGWNAYKWATYAAKYGHFQEGGTPVVGSIMVEPAVGGDVGHVAYVDKVFDSRHFVTTEMNTDGNGTPGKVFTVYDDTGTPDGHAGQYALRRHIRAGTVFIYGGPVVTPPEYAGYLGHIVQWDGDTKAQKTAWLVVNDGGRLRRRWISDISTYWCLRNSGAPGPDVLPSNVLDAMADETGVPATCAGAGGDGPAPPDAYTELEGHNGTNTFSDPTTATGQGAFIGAGQQVQVACKVYAPQIASVNPDGFWYRIASSPWNGGYYAPANTFMNGDPWTGPYTHNTDFSVPTCGGSQPPPTTTTTTTTSPPPPPPPPSPTWNETAGGVAHTWTNYTNAGGTQGPSVQGGQTIAISCKVTGFKVADGNTWWYRIASSPWNNQYYVSADAFYNNGQTSGSLSGTPFVDPAVANC